MKALVTGGAGFIGSHIARRLVDDGHEVVVFDDLSLGHRENVPTGARFVQSTIIESAALRAAMQDVDVVFHQAALPSVPRSIEAPVASHVVNATGTLIVLEAARHAGVRKVIYAASSSAYGDAPTLPKVETMATDPRSPYAAAKLAGENYCRAFFHSYGLRTTSLRYFNVYGPRQDPNGAYAAVIPRFILNSFQGDPLPINGDGRQSRDFTFVDDVVAANLLAASSSASDGKVINIGAGRQTSVLDLANQVITLTGSASVKVHRPTRFGDVRDSLADIRLARETLGYEPSTHIPDGLRRTVAWFKALRGV